MMPYLLKRPNSPNWRVRFQYPGGKSKEVSLGTPDLREAELRSLTIAADHKRKLIENRPRRETQWCPRVDGRGIQKLEERDELGYPPAELSRLWSRRREITFLDAAGQPVRTEPNGGYHAVIVNLPEKFVCMPVSPTTRARRTAATCPTFRTSILATSKTRRRNRRRAAAKTTRCLMRTSHKRSKPRQREGGAKYWMLFRTLVKKPLKDCERDDARVMLKHFQDQGLKSATIRRKFVWLVAVCNTLSRKAKSNSIRSRSSPKSGDDSMERVPLDDADLKLCVRNLGKVGEADQVLFRLLASTGMRLGEGFPD